MPVLSLKHTDGYLSFDSDQCAAVGKSLTERYTKARPFPHIVLDDFLDGSVLKQVAEEFPGSGEQCSFDRDQERLKFQYHPEAVPSRLIRNLLNELNSEAFIRFVEALTGIHGLIVDPYFLGGGLHETRRGGHLGVHADFNLHKVMKVERRLNLLIYLNEDWKPEYGGELELWDQQMTAAQERIRPELGRAVIFNTSLDSFHGHPEPLTCPPERRRRSIALYYYTAIDDSHAIPERTTNFQKRPGTSDKSDWAVRGRHFVNDWVPPKLQRIARGALRKVGLS